MTPLRHGRESSKVEKKVEILLWYVADLSQGLRAARMNEPHNRGGEGLHLSSARRVRGAVMVKTVQGQGGLVDSIQVPQGRGQLLSLISEVPQGRGQLLSLSK